MHDSYNIYFEKADWIFYMNQWHILIKLHLPMKKKSQRLKLVKTPEGDDWESQCKHITIYQVCLSTILLSIDNDFSLNQSSYLNATCHSFPSNPTIVTVIPPAEHSLLFIFSWLSNNEQRKQPADHVLFSTQPSILFSFVDSIFGTSECQENLINVGEK